jgi:hypothetical protein
MTSTLTTATAPTRTGRGILLSLLAAGVLASIVNIVIGIAARAAGGDATVTGMMIPAEIGATIFGLLFGAIGWIIVRRAAKRPARVLSVLVPVVFVLSLIPVIGFGAQSGTTSVWTAMVGLGIMHLVTIAIAVPVYRRFLPLSR